MVIPVTEVRAAVRSATRAAALAPQARRLLEGPVLPTLVRLAAPTVALMLLQGVIAAGEAAFVGRLGSAALAGVSLSFPLVMLMTTLSAGAYGGGVASGIARALGAGRVEDATRLAGTALGMAAIMASAWMVAMLVLGRVLYAALGASGPSLEAAVRYSDVLFLGAVPFWLFNAAASILRGSGNTLYPAVAGAVGGVVTLAASPLVIFGAGPVPGLGITGAAWAVVAYNVAMAVVLLRAVRGPGSLARPGFRSFVPRRSYAFEILRISVPSAASSLLSNLTFILLTALVAPFGTEAIAGYGVGGRLEYLLIPIVFGVGSALVPLVAASDGAGDFARVRSLTRAGAGLGAGACGLIGLTAAMFPGAWMRLFTADQAVVGFGQSYLVCVGPAYAFLGMGLALYFAAQGRGRTVQPLLATLTRLLVAGALGSLALRILGWGVDSLFSLMALGLVAYGTVMVGVMRRELGLVPGRRILHILLAAGFCVGLAGCSPGAAGAPPDTAAVTVSLPVEREVTDYVDFTARTAAVDSVEVRAHVWGYLDKVNFKEGALVQKGDVLFELDPRPYLALLNQAKAKVVQDEAQLTYDEAEHQRNLKLVETGAVSRSDLDKTAAARGVDVANIAADKAVVASRQLDLEYTKVIAPVSGRVSRYVVTVGNLIQSGDQNGGTLLTTIVSVDPMYAYFDVDEHTALRVRQLAREGKGPSPRDGGYPVFLGLANEDSHPHRGAIDFVDNQVNPKTGTIRLRGVFPNQNQALLPGLFGRVRSPIGRPHKTLLVSERAFDTDQGQKVLYVVNENNEVVARPVRAGALHAGLREVTDGLKPGERVIVSGLQQVRPGATVEPTLVDMAVSRAANARKSEQP
jgi:RND family efflux transporter MFP subunit/putative MATE family efflux protein